MSDETQTVDRSGGTADAPWAGHPDFTRKEAAAALFKGEVPMTTEMAKGIAAAVLKGVSPQEIAKQFGFQPQYASKVVRAQGVQNRVRSKVGKAMEAAGLTLENQILKLKDLQGATKVVTASKDGIITDEKVYGDNGIQMRALEVGIELHGAFPHKRQYGGEAAGSRWVINVGSEFKQVFFGQVANPDGTVEVEAED